MQPALHIGYRPDLDGVRAVAVLLVVINHFNAGVLPSGFLGVDIFFVLSGYVVTASMYQSQTEGFLDFLAKFYARRLKRIVPALVFCVLVSALVGCFFIQYPQVSLTTGMFALIGLSNVYFYRHSSDYFGEDLQTNLFTHTWSLGVEEQFYLIFPVVFYFGCMRWNTKRVIVAMLALAIAVSFAIFSLKTSSKPQYAFYLIPARFWELGVGSLVYLLQTRQWALPKGTATVCLLIVLGCGFLPKKDIALSTAIICAAVAGLIVALPRPGLAMQILSSRAAVGIGAISYSLYLWHWPVLVISRFTVGINAFTIVPQIALIFAMAMLSYLLVEAPIRRIRIFRLRNAAAPFALTLLLSYNGLDMLGVPPNALFSADRPRFELIRPTFHLDPTFEQCTAAFKVDQDVFPPPCFYKPAGGTGQVLWLVGDSTTWALKGMAAEVSRTTGMSVVMYSDDSAFPTTRLSGGLRNHFKPYFVRTFDYVATHVKRGDIVLITGDLSETFCKIPELNCLYADVTGRWGDAEGQPIGLEQAQQLYFQELRDLAERFGKNGAATIISAPLPRWPREHRIICERQWYRPWWQIEECDIPSFEDQQQSRKRLLETITALKGDKLLAFDPFPSLCDKEQCVFSDPENNINFWIDETHLSNAGGRRLAPDFIRFLKLHDLILSE